MFPAHMQAYKVGRPSRLQLSVKSDEKRMKSCGIAAKLTRYLSKGQPATSHFGCNDPFWARAVRLSKKNRGKRARAPLHTLEFLHWGLQPEHYELLTRSLSFFAEYFKEFPQPLKIRGGPQKATSTAGWERNKCWVWLHHRHGHRLPSRLGPWLTQYRNKEALNTKHMPIDSRTHCSMGLMGIY